MTTATFADRLAELLADPTFEPELLAESQRTTELPWWFGQLRTDVAYARPQKMSVSPYGVKTPIGRNRQKPLPVRPREYRCAAYGSLVKHGQTGDGSYFKKPLNCGKCFRCQEWRVQLKMHQFALWAGRHTMVTASGFADPDDVRKWITGQGRAVGGQRVAMVRRNDAYTWDGVILYAQELTADHRSAAERRSRRAGTAYRDWVGKVSIGDFAALVPREATAKGREGVKRRTLTFSHWPELTAQEPDYLESDGWIEGGVTDTIREPVGYPDWVAVEKDLPLEARAYKNARRWTGGCDALAEYEGPQRLVRDVRAWLDGDGPWREAYRPMLRLVAPDP